MSVCVGSFFFSSRRRHTRCSRDWSSDVCSSDLTASPRASYFRLVAPGLRYGVSARGLAVDTVGGSGEEFPAFTTFWMLRRSEERRVGKDDSSQLAADRSSCVMLCSLWPSSFCSY